MRLFCYEDATYNSYKNAKSHNGYSFSLGENNGHFFAKSAKMKTVTLSFIESPGDRVPKSLSAKIFIC